MGKKLFGFAKILRHGLHGISADERSHHGTTEEHRRIDAGNHVGVHSLALGRVRMEVVVVIGNTGDREILRCEHRQRRVRLAFGHRRDIEMTGGKRTITRTGPRSNFQRFESGVSGKGGNLLKV